MLFIWFIIFGFEVVFLIFKVLIFLWKVVIYFFVILGIDWFNFWECLINLLFIFVKFDIYFILYFWYLK